MKVHNLKPKRAVAGVLGALILFAMLFTVGAGYFLFINQNDQVSNQANASRQASALQASQEQLTLSVSLCGIAGPWCASHTGALQLSILNTGGVSSTVASVFAKNNGQNAIIAPAPQYLTSTPSLNITLPLSIPAGASTSIMSGCGATTCTIGIPTTVFNPLLYSYSNLATISVLTSTGNVFTAQYPPPALTTTTQVIVSSVTQSTTIVSTPGPANALIAQMLASPSQVFSAPVTDTVTVYNYGNAPATGVTISMNTPTVTGTASLTVASGCSPSPQSIGAYSGSGNAPSVTFACVYNAQTGNVGGFGSFSGFALATISGNSVTSAEAISNTIQIGGTISVTTQGAFSTDFFFFKYSGCTALPPYASACPTNPVTMPPASVSSLANGQFISGGGTQYVAYYVSVTNNFNATLPILEYSYLFLDPTISGEQYNFIVGTATNPQVPYYPNYCPGAGAGCTNHIPSLTAYTATAATCAESAPLYNPPPPTTCIDVAPGQTVTLTFAACGFGSSSWAWGGKLDANGFDSGASGCTSSSPSFVTPEGFTLGIILSYIYKNNVYSQYLPFEAQIMLRSTSTTVSCLPDPIPNNAVSSCTATVTDTDGGTDITPTGTITFAAAPGTIGTLGSGTCVLAGGGGTASCSVTFTPTVGQQGAVTISGSYPGDKSHYSSSGSDTLTVTPVLVTTLVPSTITADGSTHDTATLSSVTPTAGGTVTYYYSNINSCPTGGPTTVSTVTVTNGVVPNSATVAFNSAGTYYWYAVYSGDANNVGATSPCEPLTVNKANPTSATVLSGTPVLAGASVFDTSTLSASTAAAGGTVTYSYFNGATCSGGATTVGVPVTVTNHIVPNSASQVFNTVGSFSWHAVYSGDANNNGATSPCEPLTVNKASPTSATVLSGTPVLAGTAVFDTSTLTSASGTAGGTVTYSYFNGATCSGGATTVGGAVTVTNGVVPNSASLAFNTVGSFSWHAVYSGDANNNGATSPCEPLTVNKANPTIATVLSANPITAGGSASDSATLSAASGTAGGTVVYSFFAGGACAGGATTVSTVVVTNGVVPNSAAHTFAVAGAFSWHAVYSGDANNNGATSPCEPLTVKAVTTSTVVCTSTTFTKRSSTPCTETLTGFLGSVTGETITWSQTAGTGSVSFSSLTCALSAGGACSVTVTGTGAGPVTIQASYPGDANNVASLDTQALTINPRLATLVQSKALCSGAAPGTSTCAAATGSPVTAGNVLIISVATERTASTTCRTVNALPAGLTDTRGDTFTQAAVQTGVGASSCVYTAVYYATIASSGADTITVHLSGNPNSWVIYEYEVSATATVPTSTQGFCASGCTTAILTNPSLTYAANSFLVAVGDLYQNHINAPGPASFTQDYNGLVTGSAQYSGHRIPVAGATSTFAMTANIAPSSWAEVVVAFAPDADPSTSVSCTPISLTVGSSSECTATLTDFSGSIAGETITWSQIGGTATVAFSSSACALSNGSCSVTVTGIGAGNASVRAFYGGDTENSASLGTAGLTITPALGTGSPSKPLIVGELILRTDNSPAVEDAGLSTDASTASRSEPN